MKIFRKINDMSIPVAIIIAGLLVALSVFFTTWFFFGGVNNRTKIFLSNPQRNVAQNQNTLTAQQIQMMQQAQQQRTVNTATTNVVPPTPTTTTVKPKAK